jgi:hypothetical protein
MTDTCNQQQATDRKGTSHTNAHNEFASGWNYDAVCTHTSLPVFGFKGFGFLLCGVYRVDEAVAV